MKDSQTLNIGYLKSLLNWWAAPFSLHTAHKIKTKGADEKMENWEAFCVFQGFLQVSVSFQSFTNDPII